MAPSSAAGKNRGMAVNVISFSHCDMPDIPARCDPLRGRKNVIVLPVKSTQTKSPGAVTLLARSQADDNDCRD